VDVVVVWTSQRAAVAANHLEVNLVMPRIDRGEHCGLAVGADDRGSIGCQRGHADDRLAGGEGDTAWGRQADPQAGKAAGAGGHCDTIERRKADRGLLHHACNQRHQRLGVAAFHRLRLPCNQLACAGVEHAGGAGIQRGVDGENQHGYLLRLTESLGNYLTAVYVASRRSKSAGMQLIATLRAVP